MLKALRIESVRGRLTLYYVSVLAAALIVVGGLIYVLLARALYVRVDENLRPALRIATTSLSNDLDEGQDYAGRRAQHGRPSRRRSEQMLAIYDGDGRLLAESGRDSDLEIALPALDSDSGRRGAAADGASSATATTATGSALRRVSIAAGGVHRRGRRRPRADGRGAGVPARDPRATSCRSRW